MHRSPLCPTPPPQPPLQPAPPPFDMECFLQTTSIYDLQQVFETAAAVQQTPRHVPSERSGGDARRAVLKARADKITRSVSEVFAFSTSRTMSSEDTALNLETFGNVSCLYLPNLLVLSIAIDLISIILLTVMT
jgi:hypothetical protein